jgi:hypothetical protein
MEEYRYALMRLGGANIGPNVEKDAKETAEAMNELEHCTTLFVLGLCITYLAEEIAISYHKESQIWTISCVGSDGKRLRAQAETLAEAAIAIGEQTGDWS